MIDLWRVESRYFKFRKGIDSLTFTRIIEMTKDIRVTENELVYLKFNGLEPFNDFCKFGIVSTVPLYSCTRFSVIRRKLVSISFSDQYTNTPTNLVQDYKIVTYPYLREGSEKVLGWILFENKLGVTIVSRGTKEDGILRMCI